MNFWSYMAGVNATGLRNVCLMPYCIMMRKEWFDLSFCQKKSKVNKSNASSCHRCSCWEGDSYMYMWPAIEWMKINGTGLVNNHLPHYWVRVVPRTSLVWDNPIVSFLYEYLKFMLWSQWCKNLWLNALLWYFLCLYKASLPLKRD